MSPTADDEVGRRAMAIVRRRLIPFMFLLYIVAYLDRINIGFAALQMNRDLGFSDAVYGLGAGIFFIGYVIFDGYPAISSCIESGRARGSHASW